MAVAWSRSWRIRTFCAGYEFKKGSKGVGYYLTVLPKVTFDPRNAKSKANKKDPKAAGAVGPGGYVNGPGGLKYKDMVAGRGPKPKRGQSVKCKYVLRLNGPNGRVVDKSGPRGFVRNPHPPISSPSLSHSLSLCLSVSLRAWHGTAQHDMTCRCPCCVCRVSAWV